MEKLSIEEKQAVYEYLLNHGCDDLLAALIAERSEETVEWHQETFYDWEPLTLGSILMKAFYWDASQEGDEFWRTLWKEIEGYPEEVEDEGTKYKIEVTAGTDFSALEQLQIKDVSIEPLAIPQTEKSIGVLALKDFVLEYKYLLGVVGSIAVGAAVGLRYTGVI